MNHKHKDITCEKCGGTYKFLKRHNCPEIITKDIKAPDTVPSSPTPAVSGDETPDATTGRSLSDIEKDLNTTSVIDNKIPQSSAPKPGEKTTMNASDIVLFKDMYGIVGNGLNDMWKCKDFPTNPDTLDKLERMTVATMEYYKVKVTPPKIFFMTLFMLYGLPILKHIGVIDWIKKKFDDKNKTKDIDDKTTVTTVINPLNKIPDNKKVCLCGGKNVLITTEEKQFYQCMTCQKTEGVIQ